MDCHEGQESIIESLVEPLDTEQLLALENHIATCSTCAGFAEMQHMLDARLTAAVPAAHLSPAFRGTLKKKLRRDPLTAWPEFLPDLAHFVGCAVAIVLSIFLLPMRPEMVILAGVAFTSLTYLLQAALRTSLDGLE